MELRRFDELEPVPWRNGGGITREVMRVGSDDDFLVRVSIADVDAPGPFSVFDGVDRMILLLDGPGMRLRLPAGPVDLRPGEPFAFDGAVPVRGEITSATRDLNVMTRRGRVTASMLVQAPGDRGEVTGWRVVVIGLDGGAAVWRPDTPDRRTELGRWDSAVAEGSVTVDGNAAVIVIDEQPERYSSRR